MLSSLLQAKDDKTSVITLTQPDWAVEEMQKLPERFETLEDRMRTVIRFADLNLENSTGGPFAAGLFERDSGKLIVVSVNRVVRQCCSAAHAEMMTLSLAQQSLGRFDLGSEEMPAYQLVVNAQPCAMCCGAVCWSGIRSLAIAVPAKDVEDITGFDEGPIHPNWQDELKKRGIDVIEDVLKDEAIHTFYEYATSGQLIYNGRSNASIELDGISEEAKSPKSCSSLGSSPTKSFSCPPSPHSPTPSLT